VAQRSRTNIPQRRRRQILLDRGRRRSPEPPAHRRSSLGPPVASPLVDNGEVSHRLVSKGSPVPEGNEIHRNAKLQAATFVGKTICVEAPNGRFTGAALLTGRALKSVITRGKHLRPPGRHDWPHPLLVPHLPTRRTFCFAQTERASLKVISAGAPRSIYPAHDLRPVRKGSGRSRQKDGCHGAACPRHRPVEVRSCQHSRRDPRAITRHST
jgi:hypothetical protein